MRILGTPKFNEKTGSHIRVKKAIHPKDGSVFDFMICLPNDESEVIDNSPLLVVPEPEVKRCNDINSETTEVKFELVEKLLKEASIEGFNLSFPSEQSPDVFSLKRIASSYCYVTESIPMKTHILFGIKNLIVFTATVQTRKSHRVKESLQ